MKPGLVLQPESASSQRGATLAGGEARAADAPGGSLPKAHETGRPSSIVMVSTSFKTSSLAFREAFARRLSRDSARLPDVCRAREYAQLTTCNRIEVLMATDAPRETERSFLRWLSKTPGLGPGSVLVRKDSEAIAHLFRVATGLDSMVVGEEQILAQVREAGVKARTSGSSRRSLSSLFDVSVNVGRRVRATLGHADVSVSSAALSFALDRLRNPPRNVLLIGTGKTARLAASQLEGAKLYVATRRASLQAFPNAAVVPHGDLRRVAARCDLIISATVHRGYVLKQGDLDARKRVILDLAFPRNIDPAVKRGKTELYNLEDLAGVFASRPQSRTERVRLAEEQIASEAESFSRWLLASRQSSALSQVYRWAESARKKEAEAALRRLPSLSKREKRVVEAMSRRLVSKLLAPPTSFVKGSTPELPQDQRLDVVQRIFRQVE